MVPLSGRTLHHGLVIVPRRQISGVGRGSNLWLSPVGCSMFSLQIVIDRSTQLAQHVTLIQHMVSLAQVTITFLLYFVFATPSCRSWL